MFILSKSYFLKHKCHSQKPIFDEKRGSSKSDPFVNFEHQTIANSNNMCCITGFSKHVFTDTKPYSVHICGLRKCFVMIQANSHGNRIHNIIRGRLNLSHTFNTLIFIKTFVYKTISAAYVINSDVITQLVIFYRFLFR